MNRQIVISVDRITPPTLAILRDLQYHWGWFRLSAKTLFEKNS